MRYLIACLILVLGFNSLGGVEQYSERLEGSDIGTLPLEVYDARYFDMSIASSGAFGFTNHVVANKVTLGYIENDFPTADEATSVTVKVTWWEYSYGTNSFVQVTQTKTLSLEYFADGTISMDDKATFSFENAHRVSVNVIGSTGPLDHVYLETNIDVERYYDMSQFIISDYGFNTINYSSSSNGEVPTLLQETDPLTSVTSDYYDPRIVFWWERIVGAEEYELEWTFISNLDFDPTLNSGIGATIELQPTTLNFDFYKNSTRVSVSENFYEIPGLFNRGYVVYRVRPIGRQGANFEYRLEGDWSYGELGVVSDFGANTPDGFIQIGADFESGKNWSHSVSYTEEGKRFEGVGYADGFGRGRQSLSHNTETNQVVINNAYFDKAGRPVISDLPTPSDREDFSFRKEYNHIVVAGNTVPMNLDNYLLEADNCVLPNPFSTLYGTGRYYSENNPNKDGANAHIPNANGYPFSKIVYLDDPTGRVRELGGFGLELQPTQHSTKMFYETPTQSELNRLFGTEVGLKEHYQKTITIDANGQAYVQYTDLAGRVVASGLAGGSPANLDKLPNNVGSTSITDEIYNSSLDNNLDPTIAEYSFNKVVLEDNSTITINHSFDPAVFEDPNCINGICFDCHYDFEIIVKRVDCPYDVPSGQTAPIVYEYSQSMSGEVIDQACNLTTFDNPNIFPISGLDAGEYVISKSLKLSDDIAEAYWCEYIDNADPSCAPDFNAIYNNLYNNADFGCDPYTGTAPSISYCDFKRQQLIADMNVGGQYGLVSDGAGGIDVSLHELSIYNSSNSLQDITVDWTDPVGDYLDEDGNVALVHITSVGSGIYSPAIVSGAIIYTVGGLEYVHPEDLASVNDFITYFQPSWGEALITYHPEYCYLDFCQTNGGDFHSYSEEFDAIQTYDQACAGGYFEPLGNTTNSIPAYSGCANPTSVDAFFTSGYFTGSVAQWAELNYDCVPVMDYGSTSSLTQYYDLGGGSYLSLWEYAVWQASCSNLSDLTSIQNCVNNTPLDDCNKELIWQLFKQGYQELRDQAYLFAQTAYVSYPATYTGGGCDRNGHNGCIGDGGIVASVCFDPEKYLPGPVSTPQEIQCSSDHPYYANPYSAKTPRFNNFTGEQLTIPSGYNNFSTLADAQQYVDDQLEIICQSSCEAQADGWMEALEDCVSPGTPEYTAIRNGFIEVCVTGCDNANIQGASDLANAPTTASPSGYGSFEDVLIAVLGTGYETTSCSNLLISSPAPYGSNVVQITQTPLDECACDNVLQAKLDFSNNTDPSITSVEDQLMENEGISFDLALSLACACEQEYINSHGTAWTSGATWNATSISNLEASNLRVPNELSCTAQACQDCAAIASLNTSFESRFGSSVSQDPNYEVLLENYMNFSLSYTLTSDDYETFMEACNATSNDPVCTMSDLAYVLTDMIDVIARRGQLIGTSIPLADNIVYENSSMDQFIGSGANYTGAVSGNDLTMYIGSSTMTLSIPSGSDFDFSDILSVYHFSPLECTASNEFSLLARIMKCGEIEERIIHGQTNDFDLVTCYCGGSSPTLCNSSTGLFISNDCYIDELIAINSLSFDQYEYELGEAKDAFVNNYTSQCTSAFDTEIMTQTYDDNQYQFTLYYYDQAGNLVQTVSPEGVDLDFASGATFGDVDSDRALEMPNIPSHDFKTGYEYNSYNQLVSTTNPDQDGVTKFWYDRYGRIIASQNPVQAPFQYSYSLYDEQGRPVEVGQINRQLKNGNTLLEFTESQIKQDDQGVWFKNWVYSGARSEVTLTTYDQYPDALTPTKFKQTPSDDNLRLRVASVRYYSIIPATINYDTDFESALYYAYDEHGNVLEQIQDVPMMSAVEQDIKSTQYEFELISRNMSKVVYQEGELDFMEHEYHYDQLNRLIEVLTSTDNVHQTREAHYQYFDYGPLARAEIGHYKVQGQDFAYTINGWMKAMNGSTLSKARDIGRDGNSGYLSSNPSVHSEVAIDVNAYTIGYFNGDYSPIDATSTMEMTSNTSDAFAQGANDLFNGNIRHLVTSIYNLETMGTTYHYDQLQRLTEMTAFYGTNTNNTWSGITATQDYYNTYSYDKNGNIKTLRRNGTATSGLLMDRFTYSFVGLDGLDNASSASRSNRLDYVTDNGLDDASVDPLVGDIKAGMSPGNYKYDALGQLISDSDEGISNISWRKGDKKIQKMTRNMANTSNLEFVYNPFGVRVLKIEKPIGASGTVLGKEEWKYTYYAYDANGQCMAVYDVKLSSSLNQAYLDEHHLYGSSRLGMIKQAEELYNNGAVSPSTSDIYINTLAEHRYELTNHLGNVQAVVTDRKSWNTIDGNFEAVVVMTSDYYPFGMQMPNENRINSEYRYAYNGMEVDNEVSGNGNSYTTEFRQYDPRLGRWKSLDPKMMLFPHLSPYQSFNDNPVIFIDPYGLNHFLPGEHDPNQQTRTVEPAESGFGIWDFLDDPSVIGVLAHTTFSAYMNRIDGGAGNWDTEAELVGGGYFGADGRADLLYIGSVDMRGSVWELKPMSYQKEPKRTSAILQAEGYAIAANNLEYEGKTDWALGTSNGTPKPFSEPTLELTAGEYVFHYWTRKNDANQGLIFYKVVKGPRKPQTVVKPIPVDDPVVIPPGVPVLDPYLDPSTPTITPIPEPGGYTTDPNKAHEIKWDPNNPNAHDLPFEDLLKNIEKINWEAVTGAIIIGTIPLIPIILL